VFWYFCIIPHLRHWFTNKKESELLRWHKEKHKKDVGMIRHPADATQWQNIDSRNAEFVIDPRNIKIAMSIDGMNPFLNNSTHSTWPIMLTILNLPPRLRPGPQQSRNDTNTYLRRLVEYLKVLWFNDGVQICDERKHEYFQLKAILFLTVSDSPTSRNLSGQRKKVGCGCLYCFREIDSQYLSES
jgi:hypothetical protein